MPRTRLICGLLLFFLMRSSFGIECPLAETRSASQGGADRTKFAAARLAATRGGGAASESQLNMLVRVKNRLAKVARLSPQLRICDSDTLQAAAHPAGIIFLFDGILKLIGTDEHVAAFVIGHELGHLLAWNSSRLQAQKQGAARTGAARAVQSALEPGGKGLGPLVERQAADAIATRSSRSLEAEADYIGYQMLLLAGFESEGALKAARLMIAYSKQGRRPADYFSSHPGWGERLAELERVIDDDAGGRTLPATARERAEANALYGAIADALVASQNETALALHVAAWLRQVPKSGIAWYYKAVQLQMSGSSTALVLDALEQAVTYNSNLAAAWVALCVGLFEQGHKLESASCARNIKSAELLDQYHSRIRRVVVVAGGYNMLPPRLYIARDANGSRILTNDAGVIKSRDLPLTPMPPDWKRLPH